MQTGAACYESRDYEGAQRAFEAALAAQPDLTPARFNLAVIFRELEQNEAAENLFQEVLKSGELSAETHNNLGILAARREEYDVAEAQFREAIRLRFQFPLAHFNLSTLLLRLGQWDEGWQEYEWRWQTPTFTPIECPQPQWDGQPLDGTLLLHTEQGIGDTLQFARFIPEVRRRCQRIIFLRPDHLDCLFPSSWADEIIGPGQISLDRFQMTLPLMSVPRVLGLSVSDLPGAENYLTPEDRHFDLGNAHVADARLKVGIAWFGSPTYVSDGFRSTTLASFAPLFRVPRVAFYSLQLDPRPQDRRTLAEHSAVIRDLGSIQSDLADAAAIIRHLDLVITVDTALLHLCGGLGTPVWGLISRRSDWRWMDHEALSPWYPSLRLFRQCELNDWEELLGRVAVELRERVADAG